MQRLLSSRPFHLWHYGTHVARKVKTSSLAFAESPPAQGQKASLLGTVTSFQIPVSFINLFLPYHFLVVGVHVQFKVECSLPRFHGTC